MKRTIIVAVVGLLACGVVAAPVCVDGVCYPNEEAARAAGVLAGAAESGPELSRRLAMGYMPPADFIAFLQGGRKGAEADTGQDAGELEGLGPASAILIILLGGLLMNLTPCVLPLVPVSLAILGRGAARGASYGLGMALAYGALGAASAFGGLAFGAIQSSPWFNISVAAVFTLLGLATGEVFFIDFSRFRPRPKTGVDVTAKRGLTGPFLLGAGTAVLAGACVAPILLATLVLSAKWFAAGRAWAAALPFILGAGMGLPWPFLTAGLSVLPKPGAWMRWVNRAFAVVLFGLAAWYAWLAWGGFSSRGDATPVAKDGDAASVPSRPRLLIVGAPWCRACAAMKKTTLKDPSVLEALDGFNVEYVEIDDFEDLAKHRELDGLDIKGVPAYVAIGDVR